MKFNTVVCTFAILVFCSVLENTLGQRDRRCRLPTEEFLRCGTACPLTCDNYQRPPRGCILPCVRGCFCRRGLVRDTRRGGRCVRPSECRR
uniref:Venom protein n=1 Tax=Hadrurus spadix TaxID=141984 RepID=A0A1W7R961_9SCOR